MSYSYNKLWKLLIDKGMTKTEMNDIRLWSVSMPIPANCFGQRH